MSKIGLDMMGWRTRSRIALDTSEKSLYDAKVKIAAGTASQDAEELYHDLLINHLKMWKVHIKLFGEYIDD